MPQTILTTIIKNDEEWETHKRSFPLPRLNHFPSTAPSFPVLVTSYTVIVDSGHGYPTNQAHHSFIEALALKQMLGLA